MRLLATARSTTRLHDSALGSDRLLPKDEVSRIAIAPYNNQMQRTCQKCHAFCLSKSRATFATPLI